MIFKRLFLILALIFSLFQFLDANENILNESIESIKAKAEAGDAYYRGVLSIFYRTGEKVSSISSDQALKWAEKASKQKDPLGLCNQGILQMQKGYPNLAAQFFRQAREYKLQELAATGDPLANYCMAEILSSLAPKDYKGANVYYEKAVEKGHLTSKALLGAMNLFGIGIKANLDKGIKLLRESHEGGSPIGSFTLGIAYGKGIKVKEGGDRSIELMQSAADKGYSQAQFYLGLKYSQGKVVEKDIDKAITLLEASSAQGFSEAEQMLYHLLKKRKQDERTQGFAKKKTIVAADKPVVSKPDVIGDKPSVVKEKAKPVVVSKVDVKPVVLKRKEVVEDVKPVEVAKVKNESKRKWGLFARKPKAEAKPVVKVKTEVAGTKDDLFVDFSTSLKTKAAKNDIEAMVSLATNYSVVERDHEKAAEWYIKAAKLNDAAAQRYTGMIYFMGKGVKKDYEKAVMWLNKAKANGDSDAGKKLKLLEKIIGK